MSIKALAISCIVLILLMGVFKTFNSLPYDGRTDQLLKFADFVLAVGWIGLIVSIVRALNSKKKASERQKQTGRATGNFQHPSFVPGTGNIVRRIDLAKNKSAVVISKPTPLASTEFDYVLAVHEGKNILGFITAELNKVAAMLMQSDGIGEPTGPTLCAYIGGVHTVLGSSPDYTREESFTRAALIQWLLLTGDTLKEPIITSKQEPVIQHSLPQPTSGETSNAHQGAHIINEESLWAEALEDFEGPSRRPGLWAQAFAESGGNESAAKASYLRTRFEEIRSERKRMAQVAAREAYLATLSDDDRAFAVAPKGTCPSCDRVIPLATSECPHCGALFGPNSAWSVKPIG